MGVYTAPDRRRGRGLVRDFSDIKAFSLDRNWPVFQPASLRKEPAIQQFSALAPDLAVVAAYGLLIPSDMLAVPRYGFLNIHPSLLPKYRGPSPVPSAILDGATKTGVSLMLLNEGLDTGPVVAQKSTKIHPGERADALTLRLFEMGAELLKETVPPFLDGRLPPKPQDPFLATHTAKLAREHGNADWSETAEMLCRRFRAYTPWPGLYTHWNGKRLRLLDVEELSPQPNETENRSNVDPASRSLLGVVGVHPEDRHTLAIGTGSGTLLMVRRLQLEGRRAQEAAEFLRGYPRIIGEQLPS